jgi:hypothetical protein
MHRMRSTLAGARSLAVMAAAVTVVAIGATAIMVAAMAIVVAVHLSKTLTKRFRSNDHALRFGLQRESLCSLCKSSLPQ